MKFTVLWVLFMVSPEGNQYVMAKFGEYLPPKADLAAHSRLMKKLCDGAAAVKIDVPGANFTCIPATKDDQ
jgi:hypothetical protein